MITRTVAAFLLTISLAAAQGGDSAVLEALRAFQSELDAQQRKSGGGLVMSEIQPSMRAALAVIEENQLTSEEVVEVAASRFLLRFGGIRDEVVERLREVREQDDAIGAQAACTLLLVERQDWAEMAAARARQEPKVDVSSDLDAQVAHVRRVLEHDGFDAAMRQGRTGDFFGAMSGILIPPVRKRVLPDLIALERYLGEDPSPVVLHGMTAVVRSTMQMPNPQHELDLRRLRDRLAVAIGACEPRADAASRLAADLRGDLEWLRADVATVRELEGQAAPELDFDWHSGELAATKLSELRGKVVVLDFWAWWCGACVASFPALGELAKEYAGRAVFLGVTSAQGRMATDVGVVDTTGDPEREYALLKQFANQRAVSWPIVATEQPVINREYGVLGLPTVVVVDQEGVIRATGLNIKDQAGVRRVLDSLLQ